MTPRGECDSEHNAILGTLRGTIERLGWWTATFRGPLTRYFASPPLPLTLTPTATLLPAAGPTCSARCCRPPQAPTTRDQYLREVAASADRRHRLLAVVAAAGRTLVGHEMAFASSEDAGRGAARTPWKAEDVGRRRHFMEQGTRRPGPRRGHAGREPRDIRLVVGFTRSWERAGRGPVMARSRPGTPGRFSTAKASPPFRLPGRCVRR
jgi:hypothetical protein